MHARPIAVAVLLAFTPVCLGAPRLARAQSSSDDESTKAARARFQEGVDYYDKGQYEKARAAFLQAYALRKHPAVLLNLAQSCLKSGHALEAVKDFQQFLRESTSVSAAQRADAERGLTEARQKLGRIEVQSAPTGAEISVDNTSVGNAPLSEPVDVEPGAHTVRMKASDGTVETKNVSAGAGEKVKVQFAAQSSAPAAVAPVPAPTTSPAETPPAASGGETPPGAAQTPAKPDNAVNVNASSDTGPSSEHGLLDPPKTIVPVVIGGVLVVVGVVGAIAFAVSKQSALDNGKKVAGDITNHGGGPQTCTKSPVGSQFVDACKSLNDNVNTANTDNTLANISVGVAIGGAALAVGWWLFAPKKDASADTTKPPPDVTFTPLLGGPRQANGFAITKSF